MFILVSLLVVFAVIDTALVVLLLSAHGNEICETRGFRSAAVEVMNRQTEDIECLSEQIVHLCDVIPVTLAHFERSGADAIGQ